MRTLLAIAAVFVLGLGFGAPAFAQDDSGAKETKEVAKVATYKAVMEGMT